MKFVSTRPSCSEYSASSTGTSVPIQDVPVQRTEDSSTFDLTGELEDIIDKAAFQNTHKSTLLYTVTTMRDADINRA